MSADGDSWVVFRGCAACAVELLPAASLHLARGELEALFSEATPIDGFRRIVEPSPHHTLLTLARRLGRQRGPIDAKHRRRIARALERQPLAWDEARARADVWNCATPLARLAARYDSPDAHVSFSWHVPRPRRTRLITFSGAEGAETVAEAHALRDILDRLGYSVVVEQTRPPRPLFPSANGPARRGHSEQLIQHSRQITWIADETRAAAAVAAATLKLWTMVLRHAGRGMVVISEWSALDVAAALRHTRPDATFATRLLRMLAPREAGCFLLDASRRPSVGPGENQRAPDALAAFYRIEAPRFGARTVDAATPDEERCEQIATDVWRVLSHHTVAGTFARVVKERVGALLRGAQTGRSLHALGRRLR